MTVKEHEKADEDYRYIPDLLLKQKQEELKSLDDPMVRKNLGWEWNMQEIRRQFYCSNCFKGVIEVYCLSRFTKYPIKNSCINLVISTHLLLLIFKI